VAKMDKIVNVNTRCNKRQQHTSTPEN
jgi:hypothetical protein